MNINISEEVIEIGDKEYKLFLNRKGILNWERMTHATDLSKQYKELISENDENVEITDDTNPFEMFKDDDNLDDMLEKTYNVYAKFYWVALYQNHKLSVSEAEELFNQAVDEYGIEQLVALANQMLENANRDIMGKEVKNLKALKSTTN